MQSDLQALIEFRGALTPMILIHNELLTAVHIARATEYSKLADLVNEGRVQSPLEVTIESEQPTVTLAISEAPVSALTSGQSTYIHQSYQSSPYEDPFAYTKVYSKPKEEETLNEVLELSSEHNVEELQAIARASKLRRLGYVVAAVSEEAKKQWQTFTASIEGFCQSVLMYEMAV
ncbi:hypothetical protein HY641_05245 [Candidatus Woesearchaeota archaeon]|nr:hypothetical protein [Candidatus Woesearchaeota archaeon]